MGERAMQDLARTKVSVECPIIRATPGMGTAKRHPIELPAAQHEGTVPFRYAVFENATLSRIQQL